MKLIIISIFICVLIYAILKEREELGCYRFSIQQQCNDNNSVYVKGTALEKDDTKENLYKKLESILSYHEKAGIWRRCYILALALVVIVFIVSKSTCKNNIYYWLILLLLFFSILYLFFNYINYHHFRTLKNNGIEIINKLK